MRALAWGKRAMNTINKGWMVCRVEHFTVCSRNRMEQLEREKKKEKSAGCWYVVLDKRWIRECEMCYTQHGKYWKGCTSKIFDTNIHSHTQTHRRFNSELYRFNLLKRCAMVVSNEENSMNSFPFENSIYFQFFLNIFNEYEPTSECVLFSMYNLISCCGRNTTTQWWKWKFMGRPNQIYFSTFMLELPFKIMFQYKRVNEKKNIFITLTTHWWPP